jgi:hypothetical protein
MEIPTSEVETVAGADSGAENSEDADAETD